MDKIKEKINFLVSYISQYTGEAIANNLVSSMIWGAAPLLIIIFFRIYLYRKKTTIPLLVLWYCSLVYLRRVISINSDISGFYHARYSSKIKIKINLDLDTKGTNGGTKVTEIIYIYKRYFTQDCVGIVLRRVKQKGDKIPQNNVFINKTLVRFEGRYSIENQVFCGYWVDPYDPKETAGTVILKHESEMSNTKKHYLFKGQWLGYKKNMGSDNKENYIKFSGNWDFVSISLNLSGYIEWRQQLESSGETFKNVKPLVDWRHK